jgi:hypothetical protein
MSQPEPWFRRSRHRPSRRCYRRSSPRRHENDKKFPIEKNVLLSKVVLRSPEVFFQNETMPGAPWVPVGWASD